MRLLMPIPVATPAGGGTGDFDRADSFGSASSFGSRYSGRSNVGRMSMPDLPAGEQAMSFADAFRIVRQQSMSGAAGARQLSLKAPATAAAALAALAIVDVQPPPPPPVGLASPAVSAASLSMQRQGSRSLQRMASSGLADGSGLLDESIAMFSGGAAHEHALWAAPPAPRADSRTHPTAAARCSATSGLVAPQHSALHAAPSTQMTRQFTTQITRSTYTGAAPLRPAIKRGTTTALPDTPDRRTLSSHQIPLATTGGVARTPSAQLLGGIARTPSVPQLLSVSRTPSATQLAAAGGIARMPSASQLLPPGRLSRSSSAHDLAAGAGSGAGPPPPQQLALAASAAVAASQPQPPGGYLSQALGRVTALFSRRQDQGDDIESGSYGPTASGDSFSASKQRSPSRDLNAVSAGAARPAAASAGGGSWGRFLGAVGWRRPAAKARVRAKRKAKRTSQGPLAALRSALGGLLPRRPQAAEGDADLVPEPRLPSDLNLEAAARLGLVGDQSLSTLPPPALPSPRTGVPAPPETLSLGTAQRQASGTQRQASRSLSQLNRAQSIKRQGTVRQAGAFRDWNGGLPDRSPSTASLTGSLGQRPRSAASLTVAAVARQQSAASLSSSGELWQQHARLNTCPTATVAGSCHADAFAAQSCTYLLLSSVHAASDAPRTLPPFAVGGGRPVLKRQNSSASSVRSDTSAENDGMSSHVGKVSYAEFCIASEHFDPWTRAALRLQFQMRKLVGSDAFYNTFLLAILANTILMACQYHGMSAEMEYRMHLANTVFSSLFAAEMALKLVGLGLWGYVATKMNLFDAAVVGVSMFEVAYHSSAQEYGRRCVEVC